jgi:reverse transcriptase-like protein
MARAKIPHLIPFTPQLLHRASTQQAARALRPADVYDWLIKDGYFPESYVLPPCFTVAKRPLRRFFYPLTKKGKEYKVPREEIVTVHFPKSNMTDRHFGIMHPRIHNDVAYHITRNWKRLVDAMVPTDSEVVSYSFPIPLDTKRHGRLGTLRSGRMIYEFLGMVDRDIASVAYRYSHLVKTDIKSFYPSIYTHSIAWVLEGKRKARKQSHNFKLLGNRLDKLFQNANDGCTNGIPIGPAVSDIISELLASAVDRDLTAKLKAANITCSAFRFKDDYRFLVKSEADGRAVIKHLQAALRDLHLELNEAKTSVHPLPDGLFREWASMYFAIHPRKKHRYSWKEFRELCLAVIRIEKQCPGTGVIDRFLADIVSRRETLKVAVGTHNLQRVLSMLLMLGSLRTKAFPKVMAIIEAVLNSPFGWSQRDEIVQYLEAYLRELSQDEERNKYLIAWISYFLVSNVPRSAISFKASFKDPITRSVFNNRSGIFKNCPEFDLFLGCKTVSKKVSMLRHLEVFSPPPEIA